MHLDPADYLRLDVPQSLGATTPRARRSRRRAATFSTSNASAPAPSGCASVPMRGPITASSSRGQGAARSRSAHRAHGPSRRKTRRSRSAARRCRAAPAVEGSGRPALDHRRTSARRHALADLRPTASGRAVVRGICAVDRRAGVRPRREIRSAQQAGPAHPFAGPGCAGRQHRPVVQEHAVRLEPRHGQGRMGHVHPHARGRSHAWRRASGLVAAQPCGPHRGRSAGPVPCSPPTHRRTILEQFVRLTGRPAACVPRWSLGLWVSARPITTRPRTRSALQRAMRERQHSLRRAGSRRTRSTWSVETRFDFVWDAGARIRIPRLR